MATIVIPVEINEPNKSPLSYDDNDPALSEQYDGDQRIVCKIKEKIKKLGYFLSVRMLIGLLMSMCFVTLAVSTHSLSGSLVCMFTNVRERTDNTDSSTNSKWQSMENQTMSGMRCKDGVQYSDPNLSVKQMMNDPNYQNVIQPAASSDNVEIRPCNRVQLLNWTSFELGLVLGAQNIGTLLMLATGAGADRLNGKLSICLALMVCITSSLMMPLLAAKHIAYAIAARILCGIGDALLSPSISSMIARWFPPKERPFAIGLITGGRQIGSLLILPISGYLCSQSGTFGGWRVTFFVSALFGVTTLIIWLLLSADKPTKHCCISEDESMYILRKIKEESLGKRKDRKSVPMKDLLKSRPLIVGIFALICHEYPLVITLTFLPIYFKEVLHMSETMSGFSTAVPLLALWISKTLSSSISSYINSRNLISRTALVKIFNGIASSGLALSLSVVPMFRRTEQIPFAMVALCSGNAFAGLHTPGVQTALLQIAPAYTGIITGIAFSAASVASMVNKMTSGLILDLSISRKWTILFEISAVIAFLPVIFFSAWGSADLQPWAKPELKQATTEKEPESPPSPVYLVDSIAVNAL